MQRPLTPIVTDKATQLGKQVMSDDKVYMLNVLWFQPDGGEERYRQYLRETATVFQKYGGRKLDSYHPQQAIIGDFDADLVFLVEWPSWESFQSFVADPDYQPLREIRESAISNSLLVRCQKLG